MDKRQTFLSKVNFGRSRPKHQTEEDMICLAGGISLLMGTFSLAWFLGRWHLAKKYEVTTGITETPDLDFEDDERQTEDGKKLADQSLVLSGKEEEQEEWFQEEDHVDFWVTKKGTKVHYFDSCGGLGTADRTSIQRMVLCKHCIKKRLEKMKKETSGSSTHEFKPSGLSKRATSFK